MVHTRRQLDWSVFGEREIPFKPMVTVSKSDSWRYSPFLPEVMADPFPSYRRLRDEAPAYYMAEYDSWALSRFDDIWTATERPGPTAAYRIWRRRCWSNYGPKGRSPPCTA